MNQPCPRLFGSSLSIRQLGRAQRRRRCARICHKRRYAESSREHFGFFGLGVQRDVIDLSNIVC